MPKFRKKPVVIEAFLEGDEAPKWFLDKKDHWSHNSDGQIVIHTLEGMHLASPGDWIIQGVKGELYPCKPDIFEATYEPVEN